MAIRQRENWRLWGGKAGLDRESFGGLPSWGSQSAATLGKYMLVERLGKGGSGDEDGSGSAAAGVGSGAGDGKKKKKHRKGVSSDMSLLLCRPSLP